MSFDTLAPHYRWMELVLAGEKLHRCRTAFLNQISRPKKILLLGEGHGRSLLECCHRFPDADITCVDVSERMLEQARRLLRRAGLSNSHVQWIHADLLKLDLPSNRWDLAVTNFFLDCFPPEQLQRIVSKIAGALEPNADWLIADFQVASDGLKKLRSKIILSMMYLFFRAATRLPAQKLTAPDEFLRRAGFILRNRFESDWALLHSDWWTRTETKQP